MKIEFIIMFLKERQPALFRAIETSYQGDCKRDAYVAFGKEFKKEIKKYIKQVLKKQLTFIGGNAII